MKYKNKFLNITCDGGAATGKSTAAKLIAKKYNLAFLSSGLLYRYASYSIIKYKPKNEVVFLKKKFKVLNYKKLSKINLHTPKISEHTTKIAKILKIRNILKKFQREFVKKNKGCVLEGRDASTKILPNSDIKFFFICDLKVAAKRRFNDLKKYSKKISYKEVKIALYKRNQADKSRSISLTKHPDAVVVSTSKMSKQEMLKKCLNMLRKFC